MDRSSSKMVKHSCFECLQSRIKSDFSDRLIFSYAISDSALPFGSTAIVQMAASSGDASASQFMVEYLPVNDHPCFHKYVEECIIDAPESSDNVGNDTVALCEVSQDQAEVCVEILNCETDSRNSLHTESQCSSSDGGNRLLATLGSGCSPGCTCTYSSIYSCLRTVTALVPIAHVGHCLPSTFDELASSYFSGSLEDHILCSLNMLIEGKTTGRDSINFLSLVGLPCFDEVRFPGCVRHPNIVPIIGMLKTSDCINLIFPKTPYTLENILHYSPNALNSEWHISFLIYQLLSSLAYMHGLGVAHGNICPSNIMLNSSCWSWLRICVKPSSEVNSTSRDDGRPTGRSLPGIGYCTEGCSSQGLYADIKLNSDIDWPSEFYHWWRGELSNFEYLLILNRLSGRRWGDHTFHPVLPWVIDFSTKPDENSDAGWRDLSKSKWRLAKGDEQLDFTYSTSEIPHHVSDECLSELAVCSYKARRLPLRVLRLAVRSVYEPNEYPSTMQRLYQWTPDECIPEFYCDPQIFCSQHDGMSDLAVPYWADSQEEFIKLHRDALESDRVSRQIHNWIDITFGYKMSGHAAIAAKNVMLPSSEPKMPRSVGRRQLFNRPHPVRRGFTSRVQDTTCASVLFHCQVNRTEKDKPLLPEITNLQELEEVSAFSEHARHLSPIYYFHPENHANNTASTVEPLTEILKAPTSTSLDIGRGCKLPSDIDSNYLLECIEVDGERSIGYQELLLWKQTISHSRMLSENVALDIFSVGCVMAELCLRRPLFDTTSLAAYLKSGILPALMHDLSPNTRILVEACIEKDWMRRPSARSLLDSPYFPATIKSSYLFIAPLQLLAKDESRLRYASNLAKQGALKAMGSFSAEMCAPYCLPLLVTHLSDTEAEWAYILLKEFLKCLTPKAVKKLIIPAIQKILQSTGYSHLKVSLLQDSFVREIWNQIGKQEYLELLHPLVISNLQIAPHKSSAAAASVLLIGSSEELGVPITVHQTILPLIHCFGKGLCPDGIDVLIRIGSLFGETFVARQLLPFLKHAVHSCIDVSCMNKPEPVQSWNALALIDCLMTLDGLIVLLPSEVVVKELIEDRICPHAMVLLQTNLETHVLQVAATTLMAVCHRIGPDLTALHVLPQLKELFDELAFSQQSVNGGASVGRRLKVPKSKFNGDAQIESRMDLVLLLYPSFASLLGIEKLRQGCATWLLLEQFLLRYHNWKWEYTGESSRSLTESIFNKRPLSIKGSASDYNPAKLLLNGVGWSIPQSQGIRGTKNLMPQRRSDDVHKRLIERHDAASNFFKNEPWFWFPSPVANWDGPDFLGRVGGLKDEVPWKIRASVIYSVRAHQGALRSLAVCEDESTVFTAGIGSGFKGTVQKWELARISCVSGYYGHEEVVNDICILPDGRMASCDGTIHVWNSRTGKLISVFAEPSIDAPHLSSPSSPVSKTSSDNLSMLSSNTLAGGMLTGAFDGRLYTCMHHLESVQNLVVGTGSGSLRFIDITQGQKLHLWRGESVESGFSSLVSAICSCGSDKMQAAASPSWIATGLSSGHCRLFDARSGNVIASWRAHDGFVTKLAAPEDHMLVSSSLDKTVRIWDLRRISPSQPIVFRGHTEGVSGFSVWGQDVISISRNKIGLFSLSKSADDDGQHRVTPHKLYMEDQVTRNMSVLSCISILPFSRLFAVGTEDGHLRICC